MSISTDRSVYQPADRIQGKVYNMLSVPIYALDSQAECSILGVEVQIHNRWQASSIASCLYARPVRQIKIGPGAVYTVSIHAGSPGVNSTPMPSGTYRLVLHYWTDVSEPPSVPHTMIATFSPTFVVRWGKFWHP